MLIRSKVGSGLSVRYLRMRAIEIPEERLILYYTRAYDQ